MEKVTKVLKKIYGYGIVIALFASALTVLGYLAALFIGGEVATAICVFIYKKLFVSLIIAGDIIVLLGVLAMYLSKEKAMILEKKKKDK